MYTADFPIAFTCTATPLVLSPSRIFVTCTCSSSTIGSFSNPTNTGVIELPPFPSPLFPPRPPPPPPPSSRLPLFCSLPMIKGSLNFSGKQIRAVVLFFLLPSTRRRKTFVVVLVVIARTEPRIRVSFSSSSSSSSSLLFLRLLTTAFASRAVLSWYRAKTTL